ncbi:MAG: tRNA (adenosine(37)-N6)-threonylcarbamoyltransferase complex transferase subunit TsaD [Clostridiales bacterium]|mgnify:FL=1|nr:tRNA (adenosine(37)-N6)-threonylcarbamoyltransferase complex transferase subunit TsaD [Clostridiales bacterium]
MQYIEIAREKLNKLRDRDDFLILAFESSCDETACSVVKGRKVLASMISSQIEIHKRFGGVVPEIASRNHTLAIDSLLTETLDAAGVTLKDIDVVAVTYGAGLLGALLVGLCYAKALAYALDLPLIAVNHIKGHIASNYITHPDLNPPYIALIVSGGHTNIYEVQGFADKDMISLGQTRDDAIGESFDKVARILGLGYPGGPKVEKLAKQGNKEAFKFTRPFRNEDHLDFSFSGIKTAIANLVSNSKARGDEINAADLAASFQNSVVSYVVDNTIRAAKDKNLKTIVLAGGVAANSALREELTQAAQKEGMTVKLPEFEYCTDNAAMIGVAAYEEIKAGIEPSDLDLDADPSL